MVLGESPAKNATSLVRTSINAVKDSFPIIASKMASNAYEKIKEILEKFLKKT
jgi:hypothetical protein